MFHKALLDEPAVAPERFIKPRSTGYEALLDDPAVAPKRFIKPRSTGLRSTAGRASSGPRDRVAEIVIT